MPLVPCVTNSGPATALYAPAAAGGGGGSVGNTLTLSTLTFGIGVDSNANNILMGGSGVLAMAAVGDSNQIQIGFEGNDQILGNHYGVAGFFANGAGGDITFGDINGNNSALTIINAQSSGLNSGNISTLIYGTTQILPSGAPSGAGSQLLVSSILCSSINGAAPGGGGGAAVSTFPNLTVSSSVGAGGALQIFANDTNLYTLATVNGGTTVASLDIGTTGGRNQVYMDTAEAPNFFTSTIKGATGQISLNPSGTEQIRIGGTGAPGDITVATVGGGNINLTGPVIQTGGALSVPGSGTISSLTVSSINGGVYPPAAAQPVYSTTQIGLGQQFNSLSFSGGLLQNISTILSTPTISSTGLFQLSGPLSGTVTYSGSGNTNPLNNSTNTGYSAFQFSLLIDEGQPTQAIVPLAGARVTSAGNSPPPTNTTVTPASWSTIFYPVAFNANPAPNYNTPCSGGQEFTYTQYGTHTYKGLLSIDSFLNSGDPGAGYNMTVTVPSLGVGPGMLALYTT